MNKIPTTDGLFKELFENSDCHIDYDKAGLEVIKKSMIEFAKLHVKQALENVTKITHKNGISRIIDNKESILNAYPDELIK